MSGWIGLSAQSFPEAGLPVLSNRATLESQAFANPHNNSVTVTQPGGGIALDPHDSRLTQVSNLDGMLWTGAEPHHLLSAPFQAIVMLARSTVHATMGLQI